MITTETTSTTLPENDTLELPFTPASTVPLAPPDDPQTALVVDPSQTDVPAAQPADVVSVTQVAVDALKPHRTNAAVYGDEPVDDDLIASIKTLGVINPLHATAAHVVVDGHRRLKAAGAAGLAAVPVLFLDPGHDAVAIEELLLEANRSRNKNNEQRVREFAVYLRIESERARARMLQGKNPVLKLTQGGAEKTVGKARDIAAKKVGWSWATAKKGLEMIKVLDRLLANDDPDAAKLRKLLHDKKVDAAHTAAVSHRWVKGEPKTSTRRSVAQSKEVATKNDQGQPGENTQAADTVDNTTGSLQSLPQTPPPILTVVTDDAKPDSDTEVSTIFRDQHLPEKEDSAQSSTVNDPAGRPDVVHPTRPMTSSSSTAGSDAQRGSVGTAFQLADGGVMVADIVEEGGMISAGKARRTIQALQGSLVGTNPAVVAGQQRLVISMAEILNRHAMGLPSLSERDVNHHLKRAMLTLQTVMKWR